ncbi:hypothetical protein [Streptomyces sp. NPDC017940]|uniref:hypothetical protein n=1 Tax=Streptomyces sp. NPDC017940 TaxID=3365017 RepID=UPI0037AAC77F
MGELVDAAVGWPGMAFSSAMAVVVCFWLLVALGAGRADSFDEDAALGAVGLGGVPVAVAVSLMAFTGWAVSLAGTLAVARTHWAGLAHAAADVGLLLVSALVAWGVTYALVRPYARARARRSGALPRDLGGPSPRDLPAVPAGHAGTASPAVPATPTVPAVPAGHADTASPAVPARHADTATPAVPATPLDPTAPATPAAPMTAGATALLYAYEDSGAFFWVAPCSVVLAPGRRRDRSGGHGHGHGHRRPYGLPADPADGTWPRADCA